MSKSLQNRETIVYLQADREAQDSFFAIVVTRAVDFSVQAIVQEAKIEKVQRV